MNKILFIITAFLFKHILIAQDAETRLKKKELY
jgi:hypothetical protein